MDKGKGGAAWNRGRTKEETIKDRYFYESLGSAF